MTRRTSKVKAEGNRCKQAKCSGNLGGKSERHGTLIRECEGKQSLGNPLGEPPFPNDCNIHPPIALLRLTLEIRIPLPTTVRLHQSCRLQLVNSSRGRTRRRMSTALRFPSNGGIDG
jgi:hypothetical protein